MLGLDRRAARYTWTVVFVFLLLGLVYLIRETLFIFAVALLFAYLLWPLVNYLDERLPGRIQSTGSRDRLLFIGRIADCHRN